ncbi:MAG: branched-chain amino acid ABC transporter permease, partial [Desulfocucumaceae bacterium]
ILLQALLTGIAIGCVYALVSVGLSLVYGIMDIINFAHGELLMLGMYGTFFLWLVFGLDPLFALPIIALVMALVGIAIYKGVIKPIYGSSMLAQVLPPLDWRLLFRARPRPCSPLISER